MKSLGAGKVVDYTREDFTKGEETYDFIFDTVGKTSFSRCKNSLKPDGSFLACLRSVREEVTVGYGEPKRARCRKRRMQPRGYLRTGRGFLYSEAGSDDYGSAGIVVVWVLCQPARGRRSSRGS